MVTILYLHQYYTTPKLGGGTRSYEFTKRLAASGHSVYVVTGSVLKAEDGIPQGVEVLSTSTRYRNEMSSSQRARAFLRFASAATRLGITVAPDVIYASSTPLTVGIPALALSHYHRVPYVFEVRDLWPEAPIQMGVLRNPLLIYGLRRFEQTIYRRAAHIVALSPGMADGVKASGVDPEKVSIIPNGSDLDLFKPGSLDVGFLQERGIPLRPTVAYAGALGDANAVDVLAEAIGILHKRRARVQVVVVGEGKQKKILEALLVHEGLTNLFLLGTLSKRDVARLYQASTGGLVTFSHVPILRTNSPNKFFDLLAAGRPVITNMEGWVADLVKNNRIGYVVPPGNASALADAIEALAATPNIQAMGKAARRLAEREFDRDQLATKVEAVLERAAQRKNSR